MRNAILRASYLFFAAALVAGSAFAGQTQAQSPEQVSALDPQDFEYKSEPGDSSKGELQRNLIIYRPTQQVLLIATDYNDGRTVTQQFRVGINGTIERESEYYPHPSRPGWQYERRRTLYDTQGKLVVTRFYRVDGSVEQEITPSDPPDITHGTPDIGKTPVIPEPAVPAQPLPKPKPDPDKKPQPGVGNSPEGRYPPYPDGTPCLGVPRDPCKAPHKKTNPCRATGRRQVVYPDGTLCVGKLNDRSKRPDKVTNPCSCDGGPIPYLPPHPGPDKKPE